MTKNTRKETKGISFLKENSIDMFSSDMVWIIGKLKEPKLNDLLEILNKEKYVDLLYTKLRFDVDNERVFFGKYSMVTKELFDRMILCIQMLSGLSKSKVDYGQFNYFVKKNLPVYVIYRDYIGVIAPRL